MRPTRYRRHSTTFKLELVRAYLNGEGGYKTIARKHDISHALLMIWVEKYQRGDLTEEIEGEENSREYEVKIAALERKIGQLVMELDLLKKRNPTFPSAEPLSIVSGPPDAASGRDADI
jgi:transposase-like protein